MPADEATFTHACVLGARVETNVPQGGDAGHGGKTKVTLLDRGGFAFGEDVQEDREELVIAVMGDGEAQTLASALIWAGERLLEITGQQRMEAERD